MAKAILNGQEIFGNVHLGSGGGASFDTIVEGGQISTTSAYATVTFDDISSYKTVLIRVYDTVGGVDYEDYIAVNPALLTSSKSYTVTLHTGVGVRLTATSFASTQYSGNYYNIYCDIIATNDDLFSYGG